MEQEPSTAAETHSSQQQPKLTVVNSNRNSQFMDRENHQQQSQFIERDSHQQQPQLTERVVNSSCKSQRKSSTAA